MEASSPLPPSDVRPVREQLYVVECEQCHRKASGVLPDFVECGWQMVDGRAVGKQEGAAFFCPICALGLKPSDA